MNQQEIEKYELIAESVFELFKNKNFDTIAKEYDYALKYGRDTALAIEEDLNKASKELHAEPSNIFKLEPGITIKSFDEGMFDVLIEISIQLKQGGLLIELIKQKSSGLYLEDISTFT